jgi:hypothetical protein
LKDGRLTGKTSSASWDRQAINGRRIERSSDFAFSSDITTYRILRTSSDMLDVTGGAIKILKAPAT